MPCGEINPNIKPKIKKMNNPIDRAIRQVRAFTVLLVFPSSRTKNTIPLPSEISMTSITRMIKTFVNI